jgi:hypothetical protein
MSELPGPVAQETVTAISAKETAQQTTWTMVSSKRIVKNQ